MNAELFDSWIQGHDGSFDRIYQFYYSRVLRFATALVRDPATGEDIAQETFTRLLTSQKQLADQGIENGESLLYTIVRNLAFSYSSYRARWTQASGGDNDAIDSLAASTQCSPDALTTAAEIGSYIQNAVDALPGAQRELILLRHFQELPYSQIASVLGCTIPQAKARIHYARRLLRSKLKAMGIVP